MIIFLLFLILWSVHSSWLMVLFYPDKQWKLWMCLKAWCTWNSLSDWKLPRLSSRRERLVLKKQAILLVFFSCVSHECVAWFLFATETGREADKKRAMPRWESIRNCPWLRCTMDSEHLAKKPYVLFLNEKTVYVFPTYCTRRIIIYHIVLYECIVII